VARKIEAKVFAHHGIGRDASGAALHAGGASGNAGATVHTLTPQPKPTSDKKR
jgi:hypothetical protein